MDNMDIANEKRRYKRAESNLPVLYRNLRKQGVPGRGSLTRNISEGGVCFKSTDFMSLACRLVLEISIPNSQKPIKAISKVAWVRKLPVDNQYELGNQFLEMTKEDRALIANFINQAFTLNT